MNSIVFAVAAVTIIGVICAVMLAAASKVMAIRSDERKTALRALLPGLNCGACGYPGCDGYAAALTEGAKPNLCLPGGQEVSRLISEDLGEAFEDVAQKSAVVHCGGDCASRSDKMEYAGIKSCAAAAQLFGGQSACRYGCIGFGDCASVCPNDAIYLADGIARVNKSACIGCGMCARECPNGLIIVEDITTRAVVACVNPETGASVRKACARGCIGCKRCERECQPGAITVAGNLAAIDYGKCTGCGMCAQVCPTGSIRYS